MTSRGLHLSTFILALSFGGVLVVSALFALSSFVSTQKLIEHEIVQSLNYRHSILSLSLKERMKRTQGRLSTLSAHPALIEAVDSQDREIVEEMLFSLLQEEESKNLDTLMLSGEKGVVIGDVTSPLSSLGPNKDEIIANAMDAFDNWTLMVAGKGKEKSVALLLSTPVIEPELGRVIGAIHAAVSLNGNIRFARYLKEAADLSELVIVYGDEVMASATGQEYQGIIKRLESSGEPFLQIGGDVAAHMKTAFKNRDGVGLSFVSFVKGDPSASLTDLYTMAGLFLLVAALATALGITYMVRRLISTSSDQLINYVENISQGDRQGKFYDGPVSEFNQLGHVVSDMVATIQENERYLTNLIELASSPIIAWDGDGRITKFNKAAERIFARTSEDVDGLSIKKLMGAIGFSEEGRRSVLEKTLTGSVIESWETVVSNPKSGDDHYMSWSISPVAVDENGNVATILAQGQDLTHRRLAEEELQRVNEELELRVMHRTRVMEEEISERRQIERELRKSEERFRDIAEATSDWFWEMGPDLRFTYMSDKAVAATGFNPNEILGKTRLELASKESLREDPDKWREHDALLRRHERFQGFEYKLINREGEEHVFRISGKPMFDSNSGKFLGYRGAGRDVTKAYLQKEELRIAKDLAENANQAKSEFLSSMSHELRTPLNGILGFGQLLLMPNVDNLTDKQKEFVGQIMKAGQHLLDLINEILDLAKIEARKVDMSLESVEPDQVMKDVLEMLNRLASDHHISLENKVTGKTLPTVHADFTRLKQILVNLGSNAIKYNCEDGKVVFDCEISTKENMLEFSVTDTGRGIPADEKKDLFLPFNRLGAEFSDVEGTGIGLTITHQLVELMEGKIGVESEVGVGSRFWVRLPIFEETTRGNSQALTSSMPKDTIEGVNIEQPVQILYVEDNPNNRKLMEELLSNVENVTLSTTRTAEEGLDLACSDTPDLIFLDINLPGMDGWKMLELLQSNKQTQSIPVVAVTAQAMLKDLEKGKEAGFVDYLSKPINITQVLQVIRHYSDKLAK